MFTLVYSQGGQPQRHTLRDGETIVGRAADCNLVLNDPSVSRHHARFFVAHDRCVLRDLARRNTTCVNQALVSEIDVRDRDLIALGGCVLQLVRSNAGVVLSDDHTLLPSTRAVFRRVDEAPGPASGRPTVEPERLIALLSDVSRRLVRWQPLPDILERVAALTFDAIPAQRVFLLLVDEATGDVVPRVWRSRDGSQETASISRTIIRKAIDERVAMLASDVYRDAQLAGIASLQRAPIRSFMCAPLWNQNEVIGVLYVDTPHRAEFSSADLDVLQALSSYAAVAIEQARLTGRLVEETRLRERLQRYHSSAVVEQILSHASDADAPFLAEERDVTILFADIVGFTAISESLSPSEVAALLNRTFAEMCEAVFQQEGTLDKFMGDAVLAVFGAPLPQADHALRAVRAAAAMRQSLAVLNMDPPIVLRIALNSGLATVGDIGSPKRREYTALGDVVNTCSRLVSSACAPDQIVLSAATKDRLNSAIPLRSLGTTSIRGRQGNVDLFELTGNPGV